MKTRKNHLRLLILLLLVLLACAGYMTAVSYTHLDVYKRQAQHSGAMKVPVGLLSDRTVLR